jgi:adenylate cyclase class IV
MAANIEIKAHLHNPSETTHLVHTLADDPPVILTQEDIFFNAPSGRLKLRIQEPELTMPKERPCETVGPSGFSGRTAKPLLQETEGLRQQTLVPPFLMGAELISYHRPNQPGPKPCDYSITPVSDPAALRATLAHALGECGIVRKTRTLYIIGQTRIHLDNVEGLGHFLELEIVLEPGQTATEGEGIARALMEQLGIQDGDLVEDAYVDMLANP